MLHFFELPIADKRLMRTMDYFSLPVHLSSVEWVPQHVPERTNPHRLPAARDQALRRHLRQQRSERQAGGRRPLEALTHQRRVNRSDLDLLPVV